MILRYVTVKDGKKRLIWSSLLVFVATVVAAVIGASEVFWYLLTGGFSPLVGGFALVLATLLVIRLVGATLASPVIAAHPGLDSP